MTNPTKQPKQSTDPRLRVYRGGSWDNSSATSVRAAYRNVNTSLIRVINIGFRCAQRGCRQILKVTQ